MPARKPWRTKPAPYLRYWNGRPKRDIKIKTIIVYCLGDETSKKVCGHNSILRIADLPDWTWAEISAHLRCTVCDAVGWVDTRPNWNDDIDFKRSALGRGDKL